MTGWLNGAGTEPIPVAAGRPWENGYIESFHGRLRDEFLEREEFESVAEVREDQSYAAQFHREALIASSGADADRNRPAPCLDVRV